MNLMIRYGTIAVLAGTVAVMANGKTQKSTSPTTDSEGTPGTVQGLVRDIACPIQNKKATSTDFISRMRSAVREERLAIGPLGR